MGDGRVEGILSVDVSDWEAPGVVHGKQAMCAPRTRCDEEVWAQLKAGLEDAGIDVLAEANVVASFLDPGDRLPQPEPRRPTLEPLLINTAGSWEDRPEAVTAIDNLFLAADYVRTHTDLATMEGANEAARRAVNGILDVGGSNEPRCAVWQLSRAGDLRAGAVARPRALGAPAPAEAAAARGRGGGSAGADRARRRRGSLRRR